MKQLFTLLLIATSLFAKAEATDTDRQIESLDKPLYTPFVERYIMDGVKENRIAVESLKAKMHETIAQQELKVADSVVSYATSTINNMFYIIAAASSVLVLLGWSSLKDMREKLKESVNEQVASVIRETETRLAELEKNLAERSRQVLKNQEDIANTNAVHSLWMRAGLESNPQSRIEIYDQILSIRDKDPEVIAYKADAVLELGESNWALNLANEAIALDPDYPNAYYQRACAYAVLGFADNAITDLERAVELNEHYVDDIQREKDFESIRDLEAYQALLNRTPADDESTRDS